MLSKKFTITNINYKEKETTEKFAFETTILFQLKGVTEVYYEGKSHTMEKGNIMIVNRNKSYGLKNISNVENVLIDFSIDNAYFFSLYEDFLNSNFELNPDEDLKGKSNSIRELKVELSYLIMYYSNASATKKISLSITINKIILLLISYFKKEEDIHSPYIKNQKIIEILKYIDKYYNEKLSIEMLAQKFYMSSSTLSKKFKDETGELFSKYLNEVRVTKSLEDLLYSGLSIEEIANKNGFENTRTYRRRFKEVLDKAPSEYREDNNTILEEEISTNLNLPLDESSDIYETLYSYINFPKESLKKAHIVENNKKLVIDSSIDRQQILPDKIIHIGSLEKLLEKDILNEIDMILAEIGIDYIGISSIYQSIPDTYRDDAIEKSYVFSSFGKFDLILEKLISKSVGIFYQIELSKEKLNEKYWILINFLKNSKNIFKKEFFKKFQLNCIFNLSNIQENYNMYKQIYDEVKKIDENITIGASIPCKYPEYSFLNDDDKKTYLNKVIPICEFLSFTSEPNRIYDYSKNIIADMDFFNEFVYKETISIKNLLKGWNVDLPLILPEWNTLTGENQNINGTFFRAAIILQEILKLDLEIKSYGFWINAGTYKNYKFDKKNKYNGLELFHNYSAKKPVYHVLALSSRLKGNVRFLGKECMLLQKDDSYQLLIWNPNYYNPKLSEEIRFLESKAMLYNIEIPDIVDNYYQVKRFDFSRYYGAIYYMFQNFKSKSPIDIEARNYISNESHPKISIFDIDVKDGFKYSFELDTNAIVLLEFKPIYFNI